MNGKRYQFINDKAVADKGEKSVDFVSDSFSRNRRDARTASAGIPAGWRIRIAGREEVEADDENMRDLFFPDAHLEIDEPVLIELITHAHQIVHEASDSVGGKDVRGLSSDSQGFFCDLLLLLSKRLPGNVEVVP
jgi:hypothetical protein